MPTYPRAAVREGVGKVLLYASLAAGPTLILILVRLSGDHPDSKTSDLATGAVFAFIALSYAGVETGLLFAGRRRRTLHDAMGGTACVVGRPLESNSGGASGRAGSAGSSGSPNARRPRGVSTRPRGVRWISPCWIRYGS